MWGMMMYGPFLIGVKYSDWGDHEPLIPLYNDLARAAPVRVARHRNTILDLQFTAKYLAGKEIPSDYSSRHRIPIKELSQEEREKLMVDEGEDVQMMRIIFNKLAPALTLEEVQEVARKDLIVNALTRYPRVILVRSTSTEDNIQGFSDAFSRHGIPKQVHSNNGAPFNGKDSNFLQRCFRNLSI